MTAAVAVSAAMRNDSCRPRSSASSLNSEWYQRIEKPVQDVTAGDSLNEKTIRLTMGTYRKKYPSPSARGRAASCWDRSFAPPPACSCCLTWLYWNSASGTRSSSTITQVTAEAIGQSVLLKNSFHITRPIISVLAPPSISGITYSPTAGMKTSMAPAITP